MTHDAQVLFASEDDRDVAAAVLRGARILDKPMFCVEPDEQDACKLFYRLDFTDRVDEHVEFALAGRSYRFAEFFQSIVQRTGRHIQEGFVFQSERIAPERMANHELYRCICAYFGIAARARSAS